MQPRRGRSYPHVETIADVPRPGPYSAAAPSLDLVGARVDRGTAAAWRFPVRAASQTDHITPGDVRMFIDAATRRAHLMLETIPEGRRQTVILFRAARADHINWLPERQ